MLEYPSQKKLQSTSFAHVSYMHTIGYKKFEKVNKKL